MATIKDYLFRTPEQSGRHVLTAVSGCVLITLGLLYAKLPQVLQISLVSIGVLNFFLGVSELMPRDRVRLAGALRATAYLAFITGLIIVGIVLLSSEG